MVVIPIYSPGTRETTPVHIHGRTCPVCGREHSVFMQRKHFYLLNLLVFFHSRETSSPMCTRCVRRDILRRAPVDMLAANWLWPFLFCLREIPQFVFSLLKERCVARGNLSPFALEGEVRRQAPSFAAWAGTVSVLAGLAVLLLAITGFVAFVQGPAGFWSALAVIWILLFLLSGRLFDRSPSNSASRFIQSK